MRRTEGVTSPGGLSRINCATGASESAAINSGKNTGAATTAKCAIAKSALGALTAFW